MKNFVAASVLAFAITGCVTPDRYHWGQYEHLIYNMYANPGNATPGVQIQKLTEDIQKAEARGKPVPPGVHAHLGFLYAAENNLSLAAAAFTMEKTLYPESAVFVDGLMSRATAGDAE